MKTTVALFLLSSAFALGAEPAPASTSEPTTVVFPGEDKTPYATGVAIPSGRASFLTSGIRPSQLKADGTSVYDRFGDTYTQGVSCLKNLEQILAKQGLSLKDVVYLRVHVAGDAAKGGKSDFPAWFRAYGEFFNTKTNPAKPARSTLGVASLVSADWLVEIEALAVYPRKN